MSSRVVGWACLLLASGTGLVRTEEARTTQAAGGQLIASPEPGWPQWRGPRRDGICTETGLLQSWPEGGPKLIWKVSGLGRGYSSPILTHGRIYLTGEVGEELRLFALNSEGRVVWQGKNGRSWTGPYPGARSCLAYRERRLFHMNAHGRVACLDPESGGEIWSVDVLERFGGKNITWALSECLLVDGQRLIVTPGGAGALMAALDVRNGETVWATKPLLLGQSPSPAHQRVDQPAGEADQASYASPILFSLGGRRHIVSCSLRHVFGVNADTGELLWTHPLPTRFLVIAATPVLCGDAVFVTAPDAGGGRLLRILSGEAGVGVEKLWSAPLDTCHGGLVLVNDTLYGSCYRVCKGWSCLDARTGEERAHTTEIAMGSVLYGDQRLYCLSQEGEMTLIKPRPTGFEFTGRFRLVSERVRDAWAHPVILDGRLYLRFHETLFCYDIKAQL
jgi:outer membrane protein assembly factor BamB